MKTLLALAVLALSSVAWGQDALHVTAVRDWTPTDAPRVSQVRTNVITGTVGNVRYTAQQMFTWGSQRFEIGKDYPVLKADAKSLTVMMHDKKGHEVKERLDVTGAEEK